MPAAPELIDDATSQRVCAHMNEDHVVSVYAMAARLVVLPSSSFQLTNARLRRITATGCHIQAIMCSGDLCEAQQVVHVIDPPIMSTRELRSRLIEMYHQVCAPQVSWYWRKPLASLILVTEVGLGYGGYYGEKALELLPSTLLEYILLLVGSSSRFVLIVRIALVVSIVAHGGEALYAAVQCKRQLQLNWTATLMWFVMVSSVGYPVFAELRKLLVVQAAAKKDKKSH